MSSKEYFQNPFGVKLKPLPSLETRLSRVPDQFSVAESSDAKNTQVFNKQENHKPPIVDSAVESTEAVYNQPRIVDCVKKSQQNDSATLPSTKGISSNQNKTFNVNKFEGNKEKTDNNDAFSVAESSDTKCTQVFNKQKNHQVPIKDANNKPRIVDCIKKSQQSSPEPVPESNKKTEKNETSKTKNKQLTDNDYEQILLNEFEDEGRRSCGIQNVSSIGCIRALIPSKTLKTEPELVGGDLSNKEEMATTRPKSPKTLGKSDTNESIWDKLGTLGRKKRIKEVQEVQAEGKYAIDSPGHPTAPVIPPEEYNLEDNEERCMIDQRAYSDSKFQELLFVLIEWINDELASQRIIVQDLSEDLYDGQVLQKLLEKLTGDKLDVPEVTQSEDGQKQKLDVVLRHFNRVLGIQRLGHDRWNVEAIHSKNIVSIIHLLVALARHFRPPVRLTENVCVDMVVVQKKNGILSHKIVKEKLTHSYDDVGMRCERDAFDTLFDHAPDKLQVVKKSLVTFVNKHLNKMNFEVTELETQFHDGIFLIMLMGLLEGFFVPHYSFNLTPHDFEQKVHNVNFAFELMEEVGLQKPKARPEDVVNMDLKSTLRVLYNLFLKYKVYI